MATKWVKCTACSGLGCVLCDNKGGWNEEINDPEPPPPPKKK